MDEIMNTLITVLESRASTSVIAIIAASGAFIIYSMRKRDQKKDAANIVLLEISTAEKNLAEAKKVYEQGRLNNPDAIVFPEKLRLMPYASWSKYKYLFVRDLSHDQWEIINRFYENCTSYDNAVEVRDASFLQNAYEIRVNIQRTVADFAKKLTAGLEHNENIDQDELAEKNRLYYDKIQDEKKATIRAITSKLVEEYTPDKPFKDAAYFFSLLPTELLNSPTGQQLIVLADRRIIKFKKKY